MEVVAALLAALAAVAVAGDADSAPDSMKEVVPWSKYFFQSFYHLSIIPLLLVTLVLGWLARPSTREEIPPGFRKFQCVYLLVWSICVAADWLQGPYVYALYSAYGFKSNEIAQLFVAGFAASCVFGCMVGAVADRFGRKRCCLAYCILYIISCVTKHWQSYPVLMFGRITGGIATSLLFSCFECWMVAACNQGGFSGGLLSYMFGLMFSIMYAVAIASGLVAQFAADSFTFAPISTGSAIYTGGYCVPFDLAIGCLVIGMGLIGALWDENYGAEQGALSQGMMENFGEACRLFFLDARMWLLCLVVACFEGAMYAFVFNWTPALSSKEVPPPYGVIFALFMMACMCGASLATMTDNLVRPLPKLITVFSIGICSFAIAAWVGGSARFLGTTFMSFLAFEFCCGIYFPTAGVIKSEVVPERVRGTMYNIYRVPLNAVVVVLLLSDISLVRCFGVCATLLSVALVAAIAIGFNTPSKENESLLAKVLRGGKAEAKPGNP